MAGTKLILTLQSDQVLDSPQIKNQIVLKTNPADFALNLTFTAPSIAAWNVNLPDPGANDTVVYQNKAQTLSNKTLDGTNTLPDQPQYAHLAGQAGGQTLNGGTGASENLVLSSTTNVTKGIVQVTDNLTLSASKNLTLSGTGAISLGTGNITMSGGNITGAANITMTGTLGMSSGGITGVGAISGCTGITLTSGELTGLPNTPSTGSAATSKNYVDNAITLAVSGGVAWRETLLSTDQLDNTNKAIAQAVAFYYAAQPVVGDTFIIRDGTTTETFTAVAGAPVGFQFQIGGSAAATMTNLAASITANSTKWAAAVHTNMQSINSGTGNVIFIKRTVPTASVVDRIYGVMSVQANGVYVNYGGLLDYRSSVNATLPNADPGTANFGFSRVTASLSPSEVHIVRAEDSIYEWNDDAGVWQLSGAATVLATSAPGGGVIGQATYDSSLGLAVTAGVARVKVDTTSINFNGSGELSITGGAVPTATSGPGGGVQGKVSADENFGLTIVGGVMRVKPDGSTIIFQGGQLKSTPIASVPTGLVSSSILFTLDIPGVTAPTPGVISSDIPTLDYPNGSTTGQLFDFTVPDDYDSGNIEILADYQMSAAGGDVRYQTQAKIVKISGSIDTTTYPATGVTLVGPPSTPTRSVLMTLTDGTFTRGDVIQVYISRLGADGLDTSTATWRVVSFMYRYTGQIATRVAIQTIEAFSNVAGENATSPGTIGTDIPTVDFLTTPDTAAKGFFLVPDNWDMGSDALIRIDYAMSTAVSGNYVRIRTFGNIFDVVNGTVTAIPTFDFDIIPSNDTNPHRTVIARSIPASLLTKGSYVELAFKRITTGLPGTNHTGSFRVVNANVAFGVAPTTGFKQSQNEAKYLEPGVFTVISGTGLSGDTSYPLFASSFEKLFTLSQSTAAPGQIDVAFPGRLALFQTEVTNVKIGTILLSGSGSINVKGYFEGQGATPVFNQLITPTGTFTEVTIATASFTQPTGNKRFFVVAEGVFTTTGSIGVSCPFVAVQ